MVQEPVAGEGGDAFEGPGLFEEMGGSRDDLSAGELDRLDGEEQHGDDEVAA
jgi:hypothetical protein